jgi:O-antigen/teichoic acid export membrane protein
MGAVNLAFLFFAQGASVGIAEWAKEIGSWGLLVYLVWWGTQKQEKILRQMNKHLSDLRVEIREFLDRMEGEE